MTRFSAIFTKIVGLDENDVGSSYGLNAHNKDEAGNEALAMAPPDGANFVKIVDEGQVVSRLGLSNDA